MASGDEESDAESAYNLPIVRFAEKPYPASIYTFLGLATLIYGDAVFGSWLRISPTLQGRRCRAMLQATCRDIRGVSCPAKLLRSRFRFLRQPPTR